MITLHTSLQRANPLTLTLTGVLVALPASALACGTCARGMFWALYPPILIWDLVGVVWFLALAALRTITKQKGLGLYPGLFGALLLVAFAVLVHLAMMGPVATLPFLPLAAWQNFALLRSKSPDGTNTALRLAQGTGLLAVSIIALTVAVETIWPTPQEPIDIILYSEYSPIARAQINALRRMEPDSIPTYRHILLETNGMAMMRSAERLLAIGDPSIDLPLIQDALERARSAGDIHFYYAQELERLLGGATQDTSSQEGASPTLEPSPAEPTLPEPSAS